MSSPVPHEEARAIDRLCDAFEAEWQAGGRPALEAYLERGPAGGRARLLRELLGLEMENRLRRGEPVSPGEYQQRFAADADVVAAVFAKSVSVLASTGPAIGGATLTLKVTAGPNQGQSFVFSGAQVFLLGRSKKAHLSVQDNHLSRFHFMVEINPPVCRLTDLQSRNGTWVNDRRVTQTVELHDGDVIKAGHMLLHLVGAAPRSPVADTGTGADEDAAVTCVEAAIPPTAGPAPTADDPYRTDPPRPVPPSASVSLEPESPPDIRGYQIERELGRGGMGVVYLACRESDGQRVALKTIKPAATVQPNQTQRFLREASILCQLRHHHIVSFLEANEQDGVLYFAMEYVEGTDAAHLLAGQGRLPVREAARMVCQLLSALKYAHDKRFVHRDIKPANMLITEEDGKKSVKLADFGLARVYQESQLSGLTLVGDVGGTVAFMPPEQVTQFRQVTPAADQYSAAATLYNLLTGHYLFDFKNAPGRAVALVLQEEPVPLRQRRPDLPEELAAVIHRALQKEPADRFASVHDFRSALLRFAR